ncbi:MULTISPECIES: DUF2513 domain-containing protein [Cyanophyceae]|uniref:DUF2513 domain-containing protein n=1 Tax=Cyanophyceae TaxID=3028117 RepID=UPI00016DC73E|nr:MULTISPECIES: DUF2513 domain-containing protein [Cyanophyceae]ACA99115.1 conserved hypothetical protein [Picosynechococcus sp. PCC 7002]SMH34614.1 Hypothetical protein SAMN06272755_0599 [Picosynechococcus sp. OG1]SMQ84659.1 Hypothetical protein SAMN06272774_2973 [Synechococcus sp. 7002]
MKRNWDLLRWILNQAESCDAGYPIVVTDKAQYSSRHYKLNIGEHNFEEVCEHILLLGDAGFAEVRDLGRGFDAPSGVVIDRLTMTGHDFLDTARDDTRWKKVMAIVQEKGGAVTIGVLIQILSTLMKQSFGL